MSEAGGQSKMNNKNKKVGVQQLRRSWFGTKRDCWIYRRQGQGTPLGDSYIPHH